MKDRLHAILNWISYNRYLTGFLVLIILSMGFVACESRTASIADDNISVSREVLESQYRDECNKLALKRDMLTMKNAEFIAEVNNINRQQEALNEKYAGKVVKLDEKDAMKNSIFSFVLGTAETVSTGGVLSPWALGLSAFGMLGAAFGIGAKKDSSRKDAIIAELKTKIPTA